MSTNHELDLRMQTWLQVETPIKRLVYQRYQRGRNGMLIQVLTLDLKLRTSIKLENLVRALVTII